MNTDSETELPEVEMPESLAVVTVDKAEIDMQIATAKKYPRQLSTVKRDMLTFATLDQETAMQCFYKVPRGGKMIEGPSIRLAEIAVTCFQNMRVSTKILAVNTNQDDPHAILEAMAFDVQNNTAIRMESRRRITKKRNKDAPDEDDINVAVKAGSAIAFRDAVFKVVPKALVNNVMGAAKKTAIGDAKTLIERRDKAVEAFTKMGVRKERVFARIERKNIEDVSLEDLETLIGLYTAIKDGQISVDEAFPTEDGSKPQFKEKPSTETVSGMTEAEMEAAKQRELVEAGQ